MTTARVSSTRRPLSVVRALVLFVPLFLAGCGTLAATSTPTPTLDPALVGRARAASNVLAHIAMTPNPARPVVNREVALSVRITSDQGAGTSRQPVTIDAAPPAGRGSTLHLDATDAGDGNYVARFTPTVEGEWDIDVAAHAGGFVRSQSFKLMVNAAP